MVQLHKAPKVSVLTKDGECEIHISLDININMNGQGSPVITSDVAVNPTQESLGESLIVPKFTKEKIKFGTKVGE